MPSPTVQTSSRRRNLHNHNRCGVSTAWRERYQEERLRHEPLDGRWTMSIGVGIFLMVLGAILAFAVETDVPGISVNALGVILLLIGAVATLYSLLFWSSLTPWGRRRMVERRRLVGGEGSDDGLP
jgi:Domain of unknown function (DUF6458)